jgi:L-ascorbate oxidase
MFGPLIVRRAPKLNPLYNLYDYDEHFIIINDWNHKTGLNKFVSHYHAAGGNQPRSLLINGIGHFNMKARKKGDPVIMPASTFVVKRVISLLLFGCLPYGMSPSLKAS